jgi:exosortase A
LKLEAQFKLAQFAGIRAEAGWVAAGLVFVAILGLYWRTVADMVEIWNRSATFTHGFLVLPISLWLVWRKRSALRELPVRPWPPALVAVAGAGFLWLASDLASASSPAQFTVVMMLQFAMVAVLGLAATKAIFFPLAFLLFAVPAGEFLVPKLMDLTADVVVLAVRATGVPVYREGNHFVIPTGSWSVVAACSGIRYLIASMMVGSLYAYLSYRTRWKRAAFFGVSIAVPIVANWLRAYLIVMVGHLSGNRYAADVDHLIYGWLFFGIVIGIMFWIGSFWRGDAASPSPPEATAQAGAAPPLTPQMPGRLVSVAVGAVAVATLWLPLGYSLGGSANAAPPGLLIVTPENGWRAIETEAPGWKPRFEGQRAEYERVFTKDGRKVGLYVAYYSQQTQGHELVNSENVLIPGDDREWKQVGSGVATLYWAGEPIEAKLAELSGLHDRVAVAQWYWIGGRYTGSDTVATVLLAMQKLTGRDDDSAALVIYTLRGDSRRPVDETLERFAVEMSDAVNRALEQARKR